MERCKHGMIEAYCSLCRPSEAQPARRAGQQNGVDARAHRLTPTLARSMGFLVAERVNIQACVPETHTDEFKAQYEDLALAHFPRPGTHGLTVMVAAERGYKWAPSLSLRFKATASEAATLDFQGVKPKRDVKRSGVYHVNSNVLIWLFIAHGFVLGSAQSADRIVKRLPQALRAAFALGAVAGV
jgi:hypothetical protein